MVKKRSSNIKVEVLTLLLLLLFCIGAVNGVSTERVVSDLSTQPVQFIQNNGQANDDIKYQVKSLQYSFDFTNTGMSISGPASNCESCESVEKPVFVTLENVSENTTVIAGKELPGYANFLSGQNESEWQSHVPWYESISYQEIIPGITLTYSGKTGVLKREYTVLPGYSPSSIRMKYEGSDEISLNEDGSLLVNTGFGNLTETVPVTFQEVDGEVIGVNSSYQIIDDGIVGFNIGEYNTSLPLIIDPYLEYSTYFGGSNDDFGMDIAVDPLGNAYITGYTSSCNLSVYPVDNYFNPELPFSFNGSFCHGSTDVFVTKLSATNSGNATIQFSTYLGGSSGDVGKGIAVDSSGNMYLTGYTSSDDFPVVNPLWIGDRLHGNHDVFVTKLDAEGSNFIYSTYLGGTNDDEANDIAIDSDRAVYIAGKTIGNSPYKKDENTFPTTTGAYQETSSSMSTIGDAFVSKIGPAGNTLEYSSFIGGANEDFANSIAVDSAKNAYIFGTTTSKDLVPADVFGYQKTLSGSRDAFLFKMNAEGSAAVYATYLGGSTAYDYGEGVSVDNEGYTYVIGSTASTDFPTTKDAFQTKKAYMIGLDTDAYVTKFNAAGTELVYSTYLGGSNDDVGYDIATDNTGRTFVIGSTKSPALRVKDYIKTYSGALDAFVGCLNSAGSDVEFLTYLGGYQDDVGRAVAVNEDGSVVEVTGYTKSPSFLALKSGINCDVNCFPVSRWINQQVRLEGKPNIYVGGNYTGSNGKYDAFVVKFNSSTIKPSFTPNTSCGEVPLTVTFTDNSGSDPNIVSRLWSFGDGTKGNTTYSVAESVKHTYKKTGTFPVTLKIWTRSSVVESDPLYISVYDTNRTINFTAAGYNSTGTIISVPAKKPVIYEAVSTNFTPITTEWYFGDGSKNESGSRVIHTFDITGDYPVTVTGKSCDTNFSIKRTVRVLGEPFVDLETSNFSICKGQSVTLTAVVDKNDVYSLPSSFYWTFGDGRPEVITTVNTTTHIYDKTGSFTPTVTASNAAGSSTAVLASSIHVSGAPSAFFNPETVTGVNPLTVKFIDMSDGNPQDWTWQTGDGTTVYHEQNFTHIYNTTGQYRANLTVTGCGGTSSWTRVITVNGNISPTILLNGASMPVNGTAPFTVQFVGNTTDGSLINEAWWSFEDGESYHQTRYSSMPNDNTWFNVSHTYKNIGDYSPVLRVKSNLYGEKSTGEQYFEYVGVYSDDVNVNYQVTDMNGNLLNPPKALVGIPVQFHDNSTGSALPGVSNWTFDDIGQVHINGSDPVYTYNSSGTHNIELKVLNKYGRSVGSKTGTINVSTRSTEGTVSFIPDNISIIAGENNYRDVSIVLSRADYGIRSYGTGLDLNSTKSVRFGDASNTTKPEWADQFDVVEVPSDGPIQHLNLAGWSTTGSLPAGTTNVSLGNITLFGITPGVAEMSLNSSSYAQNGTPNVMALKGLNASISVFEIDTLPGQTRKPQDTNHDGLIDDFDGNGVINFADVTTFFKALNQGALVDVDPFNYDGAGVITYNDVVAFYKRFW